MAPAVGPVEPVELGCDVGRFLLDGGGERPPVGPAGLDRLLVADPCGVEAFVTFLALDGDLLALVLVGAFLVAQVNVECVAQRGEGGLCTPAAARSALAGLFQQADDLRRRAGGGSGREALGDRGVDQVPDFLPPASAVQDC
jgi:hypothetical protein